MAPDASPDMIEAAVLAAHRASSAWAGLRHAERASVLMRLDLFHRGFGSKKESKSFENHWKASAASCSLGALGVVSSRSCADTLRSNLEALATLIGKVKLLEPVAGGAK